MHFKIWCKAWGNIVIRFLAIAGSIASLVALLISLRPTDKPLPQWATALIVIAIVCFILFVVLELLAHRGRRVYSKDDMGGIKKYMHDWIKHGGRVAIWSRDMSWAKDRDTHDLLLEKANRQELILCLPERNELAIELERNGAEICAYGNNYLESPTSRFTIGFYGRDGARLAVGRAEGNTHVIDEFNSGSHPAFHLADDLIGLVRAICADRRIE